MYLGSLPSILFRPMTVIQKQESRSMKTLILLFKDVVVAVDGWAATYCFFLPDS
jgi:hypothetical protein